MGLSIGLCYDLKDDYLRDGFSPEDVLEFDSEETVAGLEVAMAALGHSTERVGRGRELARRFVEGRAVGPGVQHLRGRLGALARGPGTGVVRTFRPTVHIRRSPDLRRHARKGGRQENRARPRHRDGPVLGRELAGRGGNVRLPAPLFLKPVAEGSSKGVTGRSLVRERRDLASACKTLLEQFRQPVLVEAFLPGREVTVGIVGHGAAARVVGVMEVSFTDRAETLAYTALNKEEYQDRVSYRLISNEPLAEQARDVALAVFRALGCRDAARVDLRCDAAGRPNFLEVNPLPGINHVRSDLPIMARLGGISYQELIGAIVDSARSRWARRR